ncbi:hypothetical protein N7494_003405 [Penicillium frequentans]|uniref:Srp40 C-terminal domain-containing protein n=1 Tax=Penicillium frequentans TaxID=3151616 RepID=A0AAD6GFP3_9EURO|nr:hypothetical protein N7494_003405 [Penicillium glabrum]
MAKKTEQKMTSIKKEKTDAPKSTTTAPPQLLASISSFLSSNGFNTTNTAFEKELKKAISKADTKNAPSLLEIFQAWEKKDSSSSSSDSDSDSSADSGSGSESDSSDSDVEMEDAPKAVKDQKARSPSPSSSSSSESDADDEDEDEAAPTPAPAAKKSAGVKRKAESSDESSSDSSSDSGSESDAPKAKKAKTTKKDESSSESESDSSASSSDSSSDSSDSSDSDSGSDSDSSESESEKEPVKKEDAKALKQAKKTPSPSLLTRAHPVPHRTIALMTKRPEVSPATVAASPGPSAIDNKAFDNVRDSSSSASPVPGNGSAKKHTGARPTPLAALSALPFDGPKNEYIAYAYADRAYADLSVTRGKGFTKEKNKKKRGSYRGGPIDIAGGKSFKFDD